MAKTKSSQTRILCAACLLQQLRTAKEETPRALNAAALKILGKSKLMKALKDLTSYHKAIYPTKVD